MIPGLVPFGLHTVRLHFAEYVHTAIGARIFSAAKKRTLRLAGFDILPVPGGANTGVPESFNDSNLGTAVPFSTTVDGAIINGIEVTRSASVPNPERSLPTPKEILAPEIPTTRPMMTPLRGVVTSSLQTWNAWSGNDAQLIGLYNDSGASTWESLDDINWEIATNPAGTPAVWSLATYPRSSDLAAVAAGAGDAYYTSWATKLLTNGTPAADGNFYIRPNWEVPLPTGTWGTQCLASPPNCIASYQHIARIFHNSSPKFKMVWDTFPYYNTRATDNSIYYPGDSYVDIVSQDVYPGTSGNTTPTNAWNYVLTTPNGLNWLSRFAALHKKKIAISEWGINSDNAGPVIRALYSWMITNNVVYQNYFDGDNFQLSNNNYPNAGAVYKSYFQSPG